MVDKPNILTIFTVIHDDDLILKGAISLLKKTSWDVIDKIYVCDHLNRLKDQSFEKIVVIPGFYDAYKNGLLNIDKSLTNFDHVIQEGTIHGHGLNFLLNEVKIKTRYVAVMDPDMFFCYPLSKAIDSMKRNNLDCLGVPYEKERGNVQYDLPTAYFSIYDLNRVDLSDLDFRPQFLPSTKPEDREYVSDTGFITMCNIRDKYNYSCLEVCSRRRISKCIQCVSMFWDFRPHNLYLGYPSTRYFIEEGDNKYLFVLHARSRKLKRKQRIGYEQSTSEHVNVMNNFIEKPIQH